MGSLQQRGRIVELLVARITGARYVATLDVIAGVATAGVPWAAWVADRLGKPMAYVREAVKGHGKRKQVEGGVAPGQMAIVVEDLTSTGGSTLNAAQALRQLGARADHCFSIFTYDLPQVRDAFYRAGVELVSLCGISTLLEVATTSGQITGEEAFAVREWLEKGAMAASQVDKANP
ncbi:orotate phosphoribosyltransferase [Chloroflexota bacterium]